MEAFIGFYYLDFPQNIPPILVLDEFVEEQEAIEAMLSRLSGKAIQIKINPRGRNARFLEFARQNLAQAVAQRLSSEQEMQARFAALSEVLEIKNPITRMECFDISHTQGQATVASCVVFDQNGPCNKAYRQYLINGITPGDDYAAMKQVLTRRFLINSRKFINSASLPLPSDASKERVGIPDILIIDGGKGQVAVAQSVINSLDLHDIFLIGISKGVTRKAGQERLILASTKREFSLPSDSKALHLLQHIRDEAHRFAITAHRKKRQRQSVSSSLEEIEGIGAKRRKALLTRFGGIQALARASCEEIVKVPGIHQALALRIYAYFHPNEI